MHQDNQDFDREATVSSDTVSDHTVHEQEESAIEFGLPEKDNGFVSFNADEEMPDFEYGAKIRVIGVGGGGCKAVECMAKSDMASVDLVAINTDIKALVHLKRKVGQCNNLRMVQLGPKTTRGLGAGSIPENGATAAQESENEIRAMLKACDMAFITVGLGGGTGTGASPLVARVAKEMEVLTVGVATLPFYSEGKRRWKTAIEGMEKLLKEVDSLILVPNQKIHEMYGQQSVIDGYMHSDQVLVDAVRGISDLILSPGDYGGVDFADVRTCLLNKGLAVISVGFAKASPKCAQEALSAVLSNRMLEDCDISGAKSILCNIFGNHNLKINDTQLITDQINSLADEEAITKFGTIVDESLEDGIRIVLVASGITICGLDVEAISHAQAANRPQDTQQQPHNEDEDEEESQQQAKPLTAAQGNFRSLLHNNAKPATPYAPPQGARAQASDEEESRSTSTHEEPRQGNASSRKRTFTVVSTHEEPLPDEQNSNKEDDFKKPAYLRKPLYTNLGRFARLEPFQD